MPNFVDSDDFICFNDLKVLWAGEYVIIGSLGTLLLVFVGIVVFSGTKLTLIGLILVTCVYGIARWRIGYPCWDDFDGPIKSGLATVLFVCLVYVWGSAAHNNQDSIKPVIDRVIGLFAK